MSKYLIWILAGVFLLLLLVPLCGGIFLIPIILAIGWALYLVKAVPQMTVEPAAFAVGAAALVLFAALVHHLAGWLYRGLQAGKETPPEPWRLRWTAASVGMVVFLAAAGIAMIVLVHEIGWLAVSREPLFTFSTARRAQSANNLKQIALGFHNYHDTYHTLPPGGTFDQYGEMQHSWETLLLPFMENPSKPDLKLPWNHPDNAPHFKKEVPAFLHPSFSKQEERFDPEGYALSHYAANSHVLRGNATMCFKDVTDGTSNTVLAGEVSQNFKPWGHPVNWRDPALGINKSPEGFGGPKPTAGAQFLFMDGSVRFLSDDVDPAVLRAISTPAGGEKVPEF